MDRENFYHWGATREIMEIIRRRNNSPETRRLVEQRNGLSRPGTLRRRYDHYTQRTVFAPTRPNKRSREEIAEIDAEIMRRANRLGGGYRPIAEEEEPEEIREGELEIENAETEEDSVIMRGDNLPIVYLSRYNTEGKQAHYIQINHIVGKLTSNKKITEEHIKKAKFEFMMDLKTLIAKTAIDPELTRVRTSMRREDRETIPDGYRNAFDKLSIRWGLIFVDDQIVIPIDLRRRLLDILHFGHSGITKMLLGKSSMLLYKLGKSGHLEKIKDVDEDCFVSPVVITVKSDKSVKIALDSRKLNDSCIKMRPHMPNMEELLNQISVEISRDRTLQLFISKIDLDYAYGQMKPSEETSRQCVFALTGGKFSGYYRFKKGFYGLADIPTIFQEKIDRTLEYCTPAWLDDIIVVTRGNKQDHEKKLFDVLTKLEKAGYRASKKKSEFFMNRMRWRDTKLTKTELNRTKKK